MSLPVSVPELNLLQRCDADHNALGAMSIRVVPVGLEISSMSASVSVNEPRASAKFSTSFVSPQNRIRAQGGTGAAFGLLIAIGLVLFALGNIYLNYLVGPTDLPFLGQ
jgi:hypothetical protein